jgi:tetratricopeptide (TPR) repeat protein
MGYWQLSAIPLEAPVTTTIAIALGILTWALTAILVSLFLARANRLRALEVALSLASRVETRDPAAEAILGFPAEPTRFVGRAEIMAAVSTALAQLSGRTAVVLHGMAGAGKTTCAVKLAYRHQRAFSALAFWSAPTNPDQVGDALRLLAVALEAQLGDYGFAMVTEIATRERWENFLPTLTASFADANLLLVLDNFDTLLTPEGQWRDVRWAPLISALTDHRGSSRVILTSRIVPAGLNSRRVVIRPVHALSRDESLRLVGDLPDLRIRLRSASMARCVLGLTQGHPQLLELADAAAANPPRLVYQLAEIEALVNGTALTAFITQGHTRLHATQLLQIVTTWITTITATTPFPSRLLLQALCRIDETDRTTAVIGANWPAVWRRSGQPGEPPSFASAVAPLVTAALIATDPIDDAAESVLYRIHPGIVEAIRSETPEPVAVAVDAQLAAWWIGVIGGWAVDPPQAGIDTSQLMLQASLAGARYLLRQQDWSAASCLLERVLIRNSYSPATSLAAIPLLRRISEATGTAKDLVVLGAALRKLDPDEAETLLRRAYDQATTNGEYPLASTTVGELVSLLRDQGRLPEALTLADQKIEHTSQAGFGSWTQLSDQGRRLQILNLLGHHEQVLLDVSALRASMADLPDEQAANDRVNPWNVREGVLDIGRESAVALERWDDALELNNEIASAQQRRGASPHESARIRFNDYLPLLRLGRLADVDQLLRDCQDAFSAVDDTTRLAEVYGARADLADKQDHPADAVDLQRISLRLCYLHPDPYEASAAHHHLANYLARAAGNPAEQRAHRLAASLLNHFNGNASELTRSLRALAEEFRGDTSGPDVPALPTTLSEVIRLVDASHGIRFSDLMITLCPDSATAEHDLADLLTTVAT